MNNIKIFVKNINLFDGNSKANVLARYNLSLKNNTTNQLYTDVVVDLMKNENNINSLAIHNPINHTELIDINKLRDIIISSYDFHVNGGSFMDNFLFFDSPVVNNQIHFEIDESGEPVEVHYMNVAV